MTNVRAEGKYLIYLVCIGVAFRRYATMAIKSIREIGGWRHDIVLLSDSEAPLPGCENVIVIDMLRAARLRYPWLKMKRYTFSHFKPELEYHVDLSRYDYILYLDCDVLVTSDRLTEIVAGLSRESAIAIQQDGFAVSSGRGFAGGHLLTVAERRTWGHHAINAGVVGIPMSLMGRRLLRDWRQLNVDQQFRSRDQGNLISLLLRKYRGQWGYIADATMGREVKPYPATFVHFTSYHKNTLMEAYYRQLLGLTLPE